MQAGKTPTHIKIKINLKKKKNMQPLCMVIVRVSLGGYEYFRATDEALPSRSPERAVGGAAGTVSDSGTVTAEPRYLLLAPFRARARALQAAEEAAMLSHELRMLAELRVHLLQARRRLARLGLGVQHALR